MRTTPVLLISYNRVENTQRLLSCLRAQRVQNIIFAVDGPKKDNADDAQKVMKVQNLISSIDWTDKVEPRFRTSNMGLRASVIDAVSHAVSQHGQVIVLEDDTAPGPLWVPYAERMLDRYRSEAMIDHISGYNLVPDAHLALKNKGSRLSRYPESFAWATWDRAWSQFDGTLEWALNASVKDLSTIVGTTAGALRWKQNFMDAESGRINSWAYRWISSMWSRNAFVLSPNANLVTYTGFDEGTHTVMKAPWKELPQYDGELNGLIPESQPQLDTHADEWVGKKVFAETGFGVARGVAITAALEIRKRYRVLR
jgi:glycosyltransferase involved in cell wall biosynthesis